MTVLPQGSEISRRRLLQFGAAAGFLLGTGSLAGCAGPTGLAITMMQGMYAGTPEKEKT